MLSSKTGHFPQGLKPASLLLGSGTAEAVPFQNPVYATSSRVVCLKFIIEIDIPNSRSFDSPPPNSTPKSKDRSLGTSVLKNVWAPFDQDDGFFEGISLPMNGPPW